MGARGDTRVRTGCDACEVRAMTGAVTAVGVGGAVDGEVGADHQTVAELARRGDA